MICKSALLHASELHVHAGLAEILSIRGVHLLPSNLEMSTSAALQYGHA